MKRLSRIITRTKTKSEPVPPEPMIDELSQGPMVITKHDEPVPESIFDRLPQELFIRIIKLVLLTDDPPLNLSGLPPVPLRVCRSWRNVAISHSSCWTHISAYLDIHSAPTTRRSATDIMRRPPSSFAECFDRNFLLDLQHCQDVVLYQIRKRLEWAKECPVDLSVKILGEVLYDERRFARLLTEKINNLRSFAETGTQGVLFIRIILKGTFKESAYQNLTHLRIVARWLYRPVEIAPIQIIFPSLTHFYITSDASLAVLEQVSAPHLQSMSIVGIGVTKMLPLPLNALVQLLSKYPELIELNVDLAVSDVADLHENEPVAVHEGIKKFGLLGVNGTVLRDLSLTMNSIISAFPNMDDFSFGSASRLFSLLIGSPYDIQHLQILPENSFRRIGGSGSIDSDPEDVGVYLSLLKAFPELRSIKLGQVSKPEGFQGDHQFGRNEELDPNEIVYSVRTIIDLLSDRDENGHLLCPNLEDIYINEVQLDSGLVLLLSRCLRIRSGGELELYPDSGSGSGSESELELKCPRLTITSCHLDPPCFGPPNVPVKVVPFPDIERITREKWVDLTMGRMAPPKGSSSTADYKTVFTYLRKA